MSTCKCGNEARPGQGYCNPCHAEWARLHRPKHSELPDEARKKANTRAYLNVYVHRGLVTKSPSCELCGSQNVQEAHHEDYSRPLDVRWLCRKCHLDLHNGELVLKSAKDIIRKTEEESIGAEK